MPYLISDSMMRQLQQLVGKPPDTPLKRGVSSGAAEAGDSGIMPFDMFWSPTAEKFRVYVPAGCCFMAGQMATINTDAMSAVSEQDDWYEFAAPSDSGDIYVIGEIASAGAAPKIKVAKAENDTTALASQGLARMVARVVKMGTRWRVRQVWRGFIDGNVLPDTSVDTESGQSSLEIVEIDGVPVLQIAGFDQEGGTQYGITDILSADPETGEITAENGEDYEILVRKSGAGGKVGFMPFGPGTGEEDKPDDPCDDHPGGGDGVELDPSYYLNDNGSIGGDGGVSLDGPDNGGTKPCIGTTCTL